MKQVYDSREHAIVKGKPQGQRHGHRLAESLNPSLKRMADGSRPTTAWRHEETDIPLVCWRRPAPAARSEAWITIHHDSEIARIRA
jgi:hypothetical protein